MKLGPDNVDSVARSLLIAICVIVIVCINLLHS